MCFDASDMQFMVDTILSACVLHNLFLDLNEGDFEINEQADQDKLNENEDNELRQCGHQMCGVRLRQQIMHYLQQLN